MSVVNLVDYQEELIKKTALNCGFKEFTVVARIGALKGDNYLGIIYTVEVKEESNEKALYLILKNAHANENFRKAIPIAQTFKREAYLYNTVIPRLLKLQEEKAISQPFTGAAKYFGCCLEDKKESILLENLKKYGYELWNRMTPMNDEHITLVFSEYARLHAASLVLRQQYPEEFHDLTKDMLLNVFESDHDKNKEKLDEFIGMYFLTGLNAVSGSSKAKAALEKLSKNIQGLFENARTDKSDKYVVLHGDCWCNNMLFKYKENGKTPDRVCFIDWQLSKVGSPALDLAYFFCVCGSKETFSSLTKYLRTYHQVLSQNLREFGCDPDEIFDFQTLTDEFKKNAWYGVFLAMMVIKLMLSNPEEAPIISENCKENTDIINSMTSFHMSKTEEFQTRLCDLVEFMVDKNYV